MQDKRPAGPQTQSRFLMLIATVMLTSLLLLLFSYGARQMQSARKEAESAAYLEIGRILGMRLDADKEEVVRQVSALARSQEDARKARIAEHVGMPLRWAAIFDRLEKLKPSEQEQVRQVIVAEFNLPKAMPLPKVKRWIQAMMRPRPKDELAFPLAAPGPQSQAESSSPKPSVSRGAESGKVIFRARAVRA